MVLAYLQTYSHAPSSPTLYIPLSNIPHADLALRPELLPVLRGAHLQPSDLLTLSDLPAGSSRLAPDTTSWLLVDHNALQGELGRVYGSRVVGCIDHHDEEGKVPRDGGDEPRLVKKSGSCASLVVEYCREAWSAMSATRDKSVETAKWDAELARVALAPVLIDTAHLENRAKTTDSDVAAVAFLQRLVAAGESGEFDAGAYYREIWTAERDVGAFRLVDLLRKDYKQWTENGVHLGVCSVVTDMDVLLGKTSGHAEFFDTLKQFSEERHLSIGCLMTRSSKGRELLIWGLDQKGVDAATKFEEHSKEKLGLTTWKSGILDRVATGAWRKCWTQQRVENSRKQVAPMLRDAMHEIPRAECL